MSQRVNSNSDVIPKPHGAMTRLGELLLTEMVYRSTDLLNTNWAWCRKKHWSSTTTTTTTILQPFVRDYPGESVPEDKSFWILLKQAWWGGSGISWTICKLFALCSRRQPRQHLISQIFMGRMPFLTPNQQCQSNEGHQSTEGHKKHWSKLTKIWKT